MEINFRVKKKLASVKEVSLVEIVPRLGTRARHARRLA
jgi:hypothetical protein